MKPKRELVRVVKTSEGEIKLDFTGKLNGRGAYICKSVECIKKAEKCNSLAHAFSCQVDKGIYENLIKELEDAE
jgi:predicted RNA-binding protein YlxR (DUF448 family)